MARKGIKKYKSLRAQNAANNKLIDQFRRMAVQVQHYEAFILDCYKSDRTIEINEKNYCAMNLVRYAGGLVTTTTPIKASQPSIVHVDSPSLHFAKKQIEREFNENRMSENGRRQSLRTSNMRHTLEYQPTNEQDTFSDFGCNPGE